MKRILLLSLSLLLLAQVAWAIPAGMMVRSERGLPFRLRLDGYRIGGRSGMTEVRFARLAPGQHWAEFQVPANGGVLNYRTQVQLIPGREARFVLVTRRGYPPVLQRVADAPLPGWAGGPGRGPGNGRSDDYGYQNQPTPFGGVTNWPAPGSRDDWYGRGDDETVNNAPGQYPPQPQQPPVVSGNGGYPNNGGYGQQYRHLFTPQDTDQLIQAMKARSFDDEKATLAKQALAESDISSEDLRRLMGSIDFDKARLDLAKYAYFHVTDRHNFYRVYDVFTFDSSVREMQQFIEQNRGA